jgi:putative tricarboxylic transport membrane protein
LIRNHPDIFWGCDEHVYRQCDAVGLNLPLIGMWVRILKVPYTILFPLILLFCLIGVYSVNNSVLDIYLMILFGVIGYFMRKFDFEPAPLALAYVLSPMLETSLRQSLNISGGSFFIFFSRPISLVCMVFVIGLLVFQIYTYVKKKKPIIPVD